MATEDLTTYTEVDAGAGLTVTAAKVDSNETDDTTQDYVYKDFGVDYFAADFLFNFEFYINVLNANDNQNSPWLMSNYIGGTSAHQAQSAGDRKYYHVQLHQAGVANVDLYFHEWTPDGDFYTSWASPANNTIYYCQVERDEDVGTYGTLYLRIYSDSAHTDLITTLTNTLHTEKYNFRYMYAFCGYATYYIGYSQNFEFITSQALSIACAQGSYALTGQALTMTQALNMACAQGSYVLTGIATAFSIGQTLVAAMGSYALTGFDVTFLRTWIMALAQGSYTLTGQALGLYKGWYMALETGYYTLTGFAIFLLGWLKRVKPDRGTYTGRTKPSMGVYTARTKPSMGDWTKRTKPIN